LLHASYHGQYGVVELLLSADAKVDDGTMSSGWTDFELATICEETHIMDLLRESGVVEVEDLWGLEGLFS
jgi:ankyrin repeat protein